MGRLCTGGSSEIGPNGRVSDDRELYSSIRGRQVVHEGSWLHIFGDSWGIMVVLKMLGGRDIMGNDDKGFFNQNGWLVRCGCGG